MRDSHTRTDQKTTSTGLIATHDVGWGGYIHPGWKRPIGERAARWALAKVYGKKIRHRGSVFKSMKIDGKKALLTFDPDPYAPRGSAWWQVVPMTFDGARNPEYRRFIIAGKDRPWYKAKARANYRRGVIEVWSDLVDEPVAVRYGWRQFPNANLCDNLRLPAPTFRTDDWPLPEMANYSKEVERACREKVAQLKSEAEMPALDRKIRQAIKELPSLEWDLCMGRYMRDPKKLLKGKRDRIREILREFDETSVKRLHSKNPEIEKKAAKVKEMLKELEAEIERMSEEGR